MDNTFNKDVFYGYLIKGELKDAIGYVRRFDGQAERYEKYRSVFEEGQYAAVEGGSDINALLTMYQAYYREVFYLNVEAEKAEENLKNRLAAFFGLDGGRAALADIEENELAEAFRARGFHFLGGRTGGYYGPYIWKATKEKRYDVELPDGVRGYTVRLLDGFISKSWLDYISFGEVGAGGWTDDDGIINCIEESYDFDSENFQVSLLKHEAQHAMDLSAFQGMSSEDLEYRAKLVELIYSEKRNLLHRFSKEAGDAKTSNGHAMAAHRIIEGFERKLEGSGKALSALSIEEIQAAAGDLLRKSNEEMRIKYGPAG